jgi:hypothetical protein
MRGSDGLSLWFVLMNLFCGLAAACVARIMGGVAVSEVERQGMFGAVRCGDVEMKGAASISESVSDCR